MLQVPLIINGGGLTHTHTNKHPHECTQLIYHSSNIIPFIYRPSPRYTVKSVKSDGTPVDRQTAVTTSEPPSETQPFYARLLLNDRVTSPDHWQDVRLLKFDISGANIR